MTEEELLFYLVEIKYDISLMLQSDCEDIIAELNSKGFINSTPNNWKDKAYNLYVESYYEKIKPQVLQLLRAKEEYTYNELSEICKLGVNNHFLLSILENMEKLKLICLIKKSELDYDKIIKVRIL